MSRFQRMIVIPEEEYRQMLSFKTPVKQQFLDIQRQHEEQSLNKDLYSRLVLHRATLDMMKTLKEKMRSNIASSTPKRFRGRASQLYSAIEPYINMNDRGEIIDDSHTPIAESHIEDLIQYAVRDHRRNIHPRGWSYFLDKLKTINVPKVSLNRETVEELHGTEAEPSRFKLLKAKRRIETKPTKREVSDEEEAPPRAKRTVRHTRRSSFDYYN